MTTLVRESPSDGVVLLRLNRPERLNALNEELVGELRRTFASLATEHDVRVVILTGTGRGFCSGIDVRNFGAGMLDAGDPAIVCHANKNLPALCRGKGGTSFHNAAP